VISIGDQIALRFHLPEGPTELEWFTLVHPSREGPDNALNPESLVGSVVLGLEGPGSRIRYGGNFDPLGNRRAFDLEIVDVRSRGTV